MIALLSDGRVRLHASKQIQNIAVPCGFTSDGATIPRWAWSLIGYHPLHCQVIMAAILHDYLISIGWNGRDRDGLFRAQLISDNVPKWKAKLMAWAVRKYRQVKA
jgi:hypothetical protein